MRPELMVDVFAGLSPGGGGIGRYVRDVIAALTTRADAPPARFAYPSNLRGAAQRLPAAMRHELPHPWPVLRALYAAGTVFPLRFDRMCGEPAVYHSPVGYGPTFQRTRLIAHVHDLTPVEHPEWFPFRANQFMRRTIPHAARHARVVLTHSEHVGRRVVEALGVDPARVVTIPPPLSPGFVPMASDAAGRHARERFGLDGEFVLHVGTLEPRKNHVRLIGAFERIRRAGFPGPLVLVGRDGWKTAAIHRRLERSPESAAIRRLPEVDDRDLAALYGACTACAYPSLEEGFGMPLLESMACGAACVISDHPALVELGGADAVTVPAEDEGALADALIRLWRDPDHRRSVAVGGPERARGYTFDIWSGRLLALYRRELELANSDTATAGAQHGTSR